MIHTSAGAPACTIYKGLHSYNCTESQQEARIFHGRNICRSHWKRSNKLSTLLPGCSMIHTRLRKCATAQRSTDLRNMVDAGSVIEAVSKHSIVRVLEQHLKVYIYIYGIVETHTYIHIQACNKQCCSGAWGALDGSCSRLVWKAS